MMDPIRIGLFGVTHPHARAHLKTLQHTEMVSHVLLCDEDEAALSEVRAELGEKVAGARTDLDATLSDESLQAAVACFPNDRNGRLCNRLLDAGLHVISEKPVALTAEELQGLVAKAAGSGLQFGVMYQNRSHPVSVEAERLIREGVVGRPTSCEARMITSQVRFRNPDHWLFDRARSGGGILSWLGCHYIDLLRLLMGEEIVEVSAIVETLSGEDIDVEDVASVCLRFESGALGSLQAGYQLSLSQGGYMGPSYDSYVAVRGTEGRVFWNPTEKPPRLNVESATEPWSSAPVRTFEYNLPVVDAYGGAYGVAFVERFIRAMHGAGAPVATAEDALAVARVVEAAYDSSRTGRRVQIHTG